MSIGVWGYYDEGISERGDPGQVLPCRPAEITLAFIGASILFLPLFVFLPKLIQRGLHADVDIVIEAFGKNK